MVSHFCGFGLRRQLRKLKNLRTHAPPGFRVFSCRVWMVSHFLVLAFGGSFENLQTSGRMCLQGLGFSCRVWMVSHFFGFRLRRQLRILKNLNTHVPAGFRV